MHLIQFTISRDTAILERHVNNLEKKRLLYSNFTEYGRYLQNQQIIRLTYCTTFYLLSLKTRQYLKDTSTTWRRSVFAAIWVSNMGGICKINRWYPNFLQLIQFTISRDTAILERHVNNLEKKRLYSNLTEYLEWDSR